MVSIQPPLLSLPCKMAYRVPTNAHPFMVPPTGQTSLTRPWRGSFVYPQSSQSRSTGPQETFVTAAETEGDIRVDLWNAQLYLQFARAQLPARDLSEWLRRNSVPLCAFMPDRLTDATAHTANQRDFQSLSRSLTQNQMVAFSPFSQSRPRGPGILIFPTSSSTDALLVGAVVLNPDLVTAILGGGSSSQSGAQFAGQSAAMPGYQQPQQTNHTGGYSYPHQQQFMYMGGPPSGQWSANTYGGVYAAQ